MPRRAFPVQKIINLLRDPWGSHCTWRRRAGLALTLAHALTDDEVAADCHFGTRLVGVLDPVFQQNYGRTVPREGVVCGRGSRRNRDMRPDT